MHHISADHDIKEDGPKEDIMILQYNLDGKVQKQHQDISQEGDNTLCWYLPTEYTYYLAPPDPGAGKMIKVLFGV